MSDYLKRSILPPWDEVKPYMDTPYNRLAYAILKQAADDYMRAKKRGNQRMIKDCERFFDSADCDYYLDGDCAQLKGYLDRKMAEESKN